MRPSRGMGAINPDKQPRSIKKRDGNYPVEIFAGGGDVKASSKLGKRARFARTLKKIG